MHFPVTLAAVAGVLGYALANPARRAASAPVVVRPGGPEDIVITEDNTLNGTLVGGGTRTPQSTNSNAQLGMTFQNNYGAASVNVYITGKDTDDNIVFVNSAGEFYYPPATTSEAPILVDGDITIALDGSGSSKSLTLPDYLSSGRVWIAAGELSFYVVDAGGVTGLVSPSSTNPEDPSADINWGFVELTNNADGIYADISYVDFVGMPLGISLKSQSGTQAAKGMGANGVSEVCSALKEQAAKDGAPWDKLCVTGSSGSVVRVMAPFDYLSLDEGAFDSYWSDYINKVWDHYSTNTLSIDTQTSDGTVKCTVSGDEMTCDGDNRGYAKPNAADIFGCNSGPFLVKSDDNSIHRAVVPRLCAAFDRSTFLIDGGDVQPSVPASSYYTVTPTNYYSKFTHDYELDGLGYAFAYDDVTPTGQDSVAGVAVDPNPEVLTVIIGGP